MSEIRGTALDFATRNIFGNDSSSDECVSTLRDLVDTFGANAVSSAARSMGIISEASDDERMMQALRGFCVLILESDRPKLTAQLVGRLVKLELATGRRLHMRQLGSACGVSKQAISNRLKSYAERLGIPRPDSHRSARESHRLMNRRNYGSRNEPADPIARNPPAAC